MAKAPVAELDATIDFVCPPQPLAEGKACSMPPNERCKYFSGGEWLCLLCDRTGHWAHVAC
jgi:hypothetical protein